MERKLALPVVTIYHTIVAILMIFGLSSPSLTLVGTHHSTTTHHSSTEIKQKKSKITPKSNILEIILKHTVLFNYCVKCIFSQSFIYN